MRRRRDSWRLTWWSTTAAPGGVPSSTAWWPPISAPAGPKPFHCWPGSNLWWWQDWRPSGNSYTFPIKSIDSDNDSVFINDALTRYCAERGIEFTRSQPYRKNDQAWIEQKNGAVVRHFVGHDRYSGSVAGPTMAHLYGAVRRYVNYFQPSFKLVEKTRHGSRVVKRYSPPATPCDRLMQHDAVSVEMKAALSEYRVQLDPVALLHAIREAQSALATVTFPAIRPTPSGESLEQFLAKLPDWWRQDAAHTSRERRVQPPPHLANSARPFPRSMMPGLPTNTVFRRWPLVG